MSNSDILITHLENISLFEHRYKDFKCINLNKQTGEKIGHFSLVFRAFDTIDNKYVIFKFFDPSQNNQIYRLDAFKRESDLLATIIGKNRCLQLEKAYSVFKMNLNTPQGEFETEFHYFVTEYLSNGIDQFFEDSVSLDIRAKLKIFHNIVLAVSALHRYKLFHRDLKPDNFRIRELINNLVIAIDLGTAARANSQKLLDDYHCRVGHIMYSAPEAFCGLSSERDLAYLTDYYALGCMFYELFGYEYFYKQINKNNLLDTINMIIGQKVNTEKDPRKRILIWEEEIKKFSKNVDYPSFNDDGIDMPLSIIDLMNKILINLANIDYKERIKNLDKVRNWINICIRVLDNEQLQKYYLRRKKIYRENKLIKMKKKLSLPGRIYDR